MPDWTFDAVSGEIHHWRIESEFDKIISDNGFQKWGADITWLVHLTRSILV